MYKTKQNTYFFLQSFLFCLFMVFGVWGAGLWAANAVTARDSYLDTRIIGSNTDIASIFGNPSMIRQSLQHQFVITHRPSFFGYQDYQVSYVLPFDLVNVGFGYYLNQNDTIPLVSRGANQRAQVDGYFADQNHVLGLSLGGMLASDWLWAGISFHYFKHQLYTDYAEAFSGDIGLNAQGFEPFSIGIFTENAIQIPFLWNASQAQSSIQRTLWVKTAFDSAGIQIEWLTNTDAQNSIYLSTDYYPRIIPYMQGRYNRESVLDTFKMGALLKLGILGIDYHYTQAMNLGFTDHQHQLKLSMQFGSPISLTVADHNVPQPTSQVHSIAIAPMRQTQYDELIYQLEHRIQNQDQFQLISHHALIETALLTGIDPQDFYNIAKLQSISDALQLDLLAFLEVTGFLGDQSIHVKIYDFNTQLWYSSKHHFGYLNDETLSSYFDHLLERMQKQL